MCGVFQHQLDQRADKCKPEQHVDEPEMDRYAVVQEPGNKLNRIQFNPALEKVEHEIQDAPAQKGYEDFADSLHQERFVGILALIAQNQGAADHDKDRDTPAGERFKEVCSEPRRFAVEIIGGDEHGGNVDGHDSDCCQDPQPIKKQKAFHS